MIMKKKSALALCAAVMFAFAAIPAAAGAEGAKPVDDYRIVAVGDSLTVGYQHGMTETSIPYGYVDRIYEQALFHGRSELGNYGILGLKTPGLIKLLDGAAAGTPLKVDDLENYSKDENARIIAQADSVAKKTPALKEDLAKADLVVLTIGANDMTSFLRSVISLPAADAKKKIDSEIDALLNNYATNVKTALTKLQSLAPNARFVMADQYLPLPRMQYAWSDNTEIYDYLYPNVVSKLTNAVDNLAATLRQEGVDITAVHIADKFKGHEGDWTYVLTSTERDIHPNKDGYQAMAESYADAIWHEYRKPAALAANVPISVIVNGKELNSEYKPALVNSRTYLALRDVTENLGMELQWIAKTKTAVLTKPGHVVSITAGESTMTVNGVKQPIPVAAFMKKFNNESKMYVPLAIVAQAIDYQVVYRQTLKAAFINS
ncbi:stalk domain-containing protein [Cohnella faecalis]|uniref:Copper amine oxidase-like N-terminal domain-containing protein n=2 Tax=Cohnella faecalis TaxID=2315694 RepID=A0A398CM94_9BACL|nr:hypothetical protein D3H35_09475 [Cohnella faecalis]